MGESCWGVCQCLDESGGFCANRALVYEKLFLSGDGADVTFELPDGEIPAHKLILTNHVPFFARMFASGMSEAQTNRVKVPDFNVQDFKAFLSFIYSGLLRGPYKLEQILILSNKYDVPALITSCVEKLKYTVCLDQMTVGDIPAKVFAASFTKHFRLADRLGIVEYKRGCEEVVCEVVDEINKGKYGGYPEDCKTESQHGAVLGLVVDLLVFAHLYSCEKLKKECLSHLMTHECDLDQDSLRSKLKAHPDLLLQMVSSFHLKMNSATKKDREESNSEDSESSQEEDGGD